MGIGDNDVEIRKKMVNLEGIKVSESERAKIEDEIEGLMKKSGDFEGVKGNEKMGFGDNDDLIMSKVDELMIENKVLECEKSSALKEVEVWKKRCWELELKVFELEGMLGRGASARKGDLVSDGGVPESGGTPCLGSPQNLYASHIGAQSTKMQPSIPVKRQLQFENETGCNRKMTPSTPAGTRSSGVSFHIVVDSDDECDIPAKNGFDLESNWTSKAAPGAHSGELPIAGTSKRKRDPTLFTSDDEHEVEVVLPRKRIFKVRDRALPRKRIFKVCDSDNDDEDDGVIKTKQPLDSDDECDIPTKDGFDLESKGTLKAAPGAHSDEELPIVGTSKTKRDPTVFTSDDEHEVEETLPRKRIFKVLNSDNDGEDDDDIKLKQFSGGAKREIDDDEDNIPISQLKMKLCCAMNHSHAQVENADSPTPRRKRRLIKSEQGVKKGRSQETDNHRRNLGVKYVEDDKGEEEYSDSESGSLGSFIVDEDDDDDEQDVQDDKSEEDVESGKDDSDASEDSSDDNLDYKDIISRLRRRRSPNTKWDLQGDMLSAFAKDPELCMKAVCVLYRQQTNDEKVCKGSLEQNGRGFSKFDALRGTRLGEFLTGGDPNGDLVKSKEELEEHDRYGLKECVRLANHYSKQLFEIYQNGEDPYFH